MQEGTYQGQEGWFDEKTSQFFSKSEFQEGEYQGKPGLLHTKSNQFFPIETITPTPKARQSGRLGEVPRAIGETLLNIGTQTLGLPFLIPGIMQSTYEKYAGPTGETWPKEMAKTGESLIYEPKTQTGKNVQEILSYPFQLLNRFAGGVGEVSKQITGSPEVATATDIGVQALPFLMPGLRKVVEKTKIPERLYTSAIKPSTRQKLSIEKRTSAMEAGVKEGILPTSGGLEKLGGKIDAMEGQIDSIIQQGRQTSSPIRTIDIADSLDNLIDSYDKSGMPAEQYQGISAVRNKVLAQGNTMTVEAAQAFKQNTYKFIRKHYGELSSAVIEAQKTVARAVKENIANQFPEVNSLNQKLGPMLELENEIQRAVKRISNRDIIGIGIPIKALAGRALKGIAGGAGAGYAAGRPLAGAIAGFALGVMDTPTIKSALAIALDKARRISGIGTEAVAIGALPFGMRRPEKEEELKQISIPPGIRMTP